MVGGLDRHYCGWAPLIENKLYSKGKVYSRFAKEFKNLGTTRHLKALIIHTVSFVIWYAFFCYLIR